MRKKILTLLNPFIFAICIKSLQVYDDTSTALLQLWWLSKKHFFKYSAGWLLQKYGKYRYQNCTRKKANRNSCLEYVLYVHLTYLNHLSIHRITQTRLDNPLKFHFLLDLRGKYHGTMWSPSYCSSIRKIVESKVGVHQAICCV